MPGVCVGENLGWCQDGVRLLLAHRRILACWGCCGRSQRLPTVRFGRNSTQPFVQLVPALCTCSEKSDRVVCEIQAGAGARWRRWSHQHHHLRGHGEARAGRLVALIFFQKHTKKHCVVKLHPTASRWHGRTAYCHNSGRLRPGPRGNSGHRLSRT